MGVLLGAFSVIFGIVSLIAFGLFTDYLATILKTKEGDKKNVSSEELSKE